jgi:hypothetical protein
MPVAKSAQHVAQKCAAVWDNDMHPKQDFKAIA